jgi:hypothetical protein
MSWWHTCAPLTVLAEQATSGHGPALLYNHPGTMQHMHSWQAQSTWDWQLHVVQEGLMVQRRHSGCQERVWQWGHQSSLTWAMLSVPLAVSLAAAAVHCEGKGMQTPQLPQESRMTVPRSCTWCLLRVGGWGWSFCVSRYPPRLEPDPSAVRECWNHSHCPEVETIKVLTTSKTPSSKIHGTHIFQTYRW